MAWAKRQNRVGSKQKKKKKGGKEETNRREGKKIEVNDQNAETVM